MRDDEKMKKAMDKKMDGYTRMGQSFANHGHFIRTKHFLHFSLDSYPTARIIFAGE